MNEYYLGLKSVVVALLLVGAFGLFFKRVARLVSLMKAVNGPEPQPVDNIGDRVKVLFTDVLGQSNVRRKKAGLSHTAIFFGFLAVQPHSIELMIRGVIPSFNPEAAFPVFWGSYLFLADILGFLCLLGFAYVIYRRLVEKPAYLTLSTDAIRIVIYTSVIVFTFHVLDALSASMPESHLALAALPVSGPLAYLFGMPGWSPTSLYVTYEVIYWVHLLVILAFLIFIPGSKHLHLLAAVPNVFLKPLTRNKAIAFTDIEAEDAESFGLGNVSELNWKHVLDVYSCTECGRCEEQCPAANTGKPLSPKELVHGVKDDLFAQADMLLKTAGEDEEKEYTPLVREDGFVTPEQLWSCTSCRACEDICPVNIQHLDIIFEARKYQVLMESEFPAELQPTFTNLENQSNPWGFPGASRGDWAEGLDIPHISEAPDAEILFFAGSSLSLDDRGKKISIALMNVLKAAGVKVAVLGAEEGDTGDDARRSGNEYLAQMLMQTNVEVLNSYNVKRILTACPHTYNCLKNEYPQFGGKFDVVHHTEYLLELITAGRLTLPKEDLGTVTFHDSCYLGRWNGIFDAPRDLLKTLNQGRAVVEPRRNGDKGFCCGGGGGRMFMEETIGKRVNVDRCEELRDTGADVVVAACPYCITMIMDGLGELESTARVVDPAELIAEALEK